MTKLPVLDFHEIWLRSAGYIWRVFVIYSEEKVKSVFMFSHKINNIAYIIVKFFT